MAPIPPPQASDAFGTSVWAGVLALAAAFTIVYLPDVGHGFISDDFRWIVQNRVGDMRDLLAVFSSNVGFYRPVVSASFAADYALWGASAWGYGLTNFALCVASGVALFLLATRMSLPPWAALLASGAWLFNFHAVNMALLWLSGRTALLATFFALITAHAILRSRHGLAGIAALVAMLSKEEAVVLPALFTAFLFTTERTGTTLSAWRHLLAVVRRMVPLWAALAVYAGLRLQSGAFWPGDAPAFYRFSFSPFVIGRNLLEYADRAGTVAAAVTIALLAVTRIGRPRFSDAERRVLVLAALWVPSTYVLTVLLPVRSSLYALLPSIGSALAVGAVASAAGRAKPAAVRTLGLVLLLTTVLLIPVYRARNVRWVRLAELSEHVMVTLANSARGRSDGGHVVLVDAPAERFNLVSAFGSLLPEAIQLRVGQGWSGELVTAADEASQPADVTFRLSNGQLTEP